jgi:hypothetical protein
MSSITRRRAAAYLTRGSAQPNALKQPTPASAVPNCEAVSFDLFSSLVFEKTQLMVYLFCNSKASFLTGFTDGKMIFLISE